MFILSARVRPEQDDINMMPSLLLPAGLLTEVQCKSKRLRKNTKASPGQSPGDETEAGDYGDGKHVSSTTKLSKVAAASVTEVLMFALR